MPWSHRDPRAVTGQVVMLRGRPRSGRKRAGSAVEDQVAIAMADPAATPVERGRRAWAAMLDSLTTTRNLLLSYVEALAQAERTVSLRKQFAAQYRRCREKVGVLVVESLGDGSSPDDPRCRAVASFVIAICDGLSVQWLLDPEVAPTSAGLGAGLPAMRAASLPGPR